MKSPILNWACGTTAVLGLPLGAIVALSSGSLLAGLASMMAVVFVVLFVCRKDIISEYNQRKSASQNESHG
ncbi:MAG: hypothetical protein PVI71_12785 [Desulfobacterales bacterium]|jgi:hypothetical protein